MTTLSNLTKRRLPLIPCQTIPSVTIIKHFHFGIMLSGNIQYCLLETFHADIGNIIECILTFPCMIIIKKGKHEETPMTNLCGHEQ